MCIAVRNYYATKTRLTNILFKMCYDLHDPFTSVCIPKLEKKTCFPPSHPNKS